MSRGVHEASFSIAQSHFGSFHYFGSEMKPLLTEGSTEKVPSELSCDVANFGASWATSIKLKMGKHSPERDADSAYALNIDWLDTPDSSEKEPDFKNLNLSELNVEKLMVKGLF